MQIKNIYILAKYVRDRIATDTYTYRVIAVPINLGIRSVRRFSFGKGLVGVYVSAHLMNPKTIQPNCWQFLCVSVDDVTRMCFIGISLKD